MPSALDILKEAKRIEIATRRIVSAQLAGGYHSLFRGQGMSFAEVRPYAPGDDVRAIDWNVSARATEPYIKVFHEERELTVWLLVDVSKSVDFGTVDQFKSAKAARIAALLAFAAIANNDRVGLILFTGKVEKFIPPKKGRKHGLRVVSEILGYRPEGKGTSIESAFETVNNVSHRRAVVFVVSDFLDDGFEKGLRVASQRHDLIPIVLTDPRDMTLPDIGLVWFSDPETGEHYPVDTSSRAVREMFGLQANERRRGLREQFSRLSLDAVWAGSADSEDHIAPLVHLFQRRARHSARG